MNAGERADYSENGREPSQGALEGEVVARTGEPPAPRDGPLIRALTFAVALGVEAAKLPVRAARPLIMSRPMRPARKAADDAVRVLVDALASVVAEQLRHNQEAHELIDVVAERLLTDLAGAPLVAELVKAQAQGLIDHLARNPALAGPLVEGMAGQYVAGLRQNPTLLRPLVRTLADDYLLWLAANPQAVDTLVSAAADGYLATLRERPSLVDALVRTVADRYVADLSARPELLAEMVEKVAADFITHLQENPELIDGVVEQAGERYMGALQQSPAPLYRLVERVGDRYMAHLQENPSNVQELLTGQSMTMAAEIVEEVRTRSSNADRSVERAVRNLLRLKPRDELAPPQSGAS